MNYNNHNLANKSPKMHTESNSKQFKKIIKKKKRFFFNL